jgi:hypothetical protein
MRPTITHVIAADGSKLTVTTRICEHETLHVRVFRDPNKEVPILSGHYKAEAR